MNQDFYHGANPFNQGKYRRVAILGIGNELNGDDAAGVLAARQLKAIFQDTSGVEASSTEDASTLLVMDGGSAPENFSGVLRRFQPDLVVMIDAAHLNREPGHIAWIDWEQTDGMSASTHTLPPSLLVKYLMQELNCRIALVGIQPAHLEFGEPVSESVEKAIDHLCDYLVACIRGR